MRGLYGIKEMRHIGHPVESKGLAFAVLYGQRLPAYFDLDQ